MNSVITGDAGFIGSHLAGYLINRSYSATVVDNLVFRKKENLRYFFDNPRFHFVQGSITDPGLLNDTFKNADGIFHQAMVPRFPLFNTEILAIFVNSEVERVLIRYWRWSPVVENITTMSTMKSGDSTCRPGSWSVDDSLTLQKRTGWEILLFSTPT